MSLISTGNGSHSHLPHSPTPRTTTPLNAPCSEKELAAVKVAKEDIDVLAAECECKDRKAAERALRLAGGDLRRALQAYLEAGGVLAA